MSRGTGTRSFAGETVLRPGIEISPRLPDPNTINVGTTAVVDSSA
jgi:hypothetical protein